MLKSWQIEGFGEEQKGILMIVWLENRTIIGKKMNRGIYAITVSGESLSGERNLVLISETIRNGGRNVIGENKKNRTISVQYISMSYSPITAGGCSESCKEKFNLATSAERSGE